MLFIFGFDDDGPKTIAFEDPKQSLMPVKIKLSMPNLNVLEPALNFALLNKNLSKTISFLLNPKPPGSGILNKFLELTAVGTPALTPVKPHCVSKVEFQPPETLTAAAAIDEKVKVSNAPDVSVV